MKFNECLNKIATLNSITELRKFAQEIYNDEDLLIPQRKALFEVYKQKLQELYRQKVDNSDNKVFTSLYWLIKKHPCSEVGMLLYELKNTDLLDKEETQILFEEYEKKRYGNNNDNSNNGNNNNSNSKDKSEDNEPEF